MTDGRPRQPGRAASPSARTWRDDVVDALNATLVGIGLLAFPAILLQFEAPPGLLVPLTAATYLVLVAMAVFRRRIPLGLRAASVTLALLLSGMMSGVALVGPLVGPVSSGALALVLATLVFGRRVALGLTALGSAFFVAFGIAVALGSVPAPQGFGPGLEDMSGWFREAVAFGFFGSVLVVAIGYVVRHVEDHAQESALALERLEAEQRARADADVRLGQAELTVTQLQRLDALGRLAGGVAHDFNNALMVLMAGVERLDGADRTPTERRILEDMMRACDNAAHLTGQLLAFGRRDVPHVEVIDPTEPLRATARAMERLLPEDIAVRVHEGDPPAVRADRRQLEQILLNLAINARDAMAQGGELALSTQGRTDGDGDRWAVVGVQDTGSGIPAQVQARMFEPFFTTKAEGEGTGLGLATVHGIVERLGGRLQFESTVGIGSTFEVWLPAADGGAPPRPVSETAAPAPEKGRILLAEDDPGVRRVMARALQRAGYTVEQAHDVPSALRMLEHGPFDLLCTDGVMPGGGCGPLIEAFRQPDPEAPVLVVSGHLQTELVRRDIAAGTVEFLAKPFSSRQLADRVRAMLHDAPESSSG